MGPVYYAVWTASFALQVYIVARALLRREFFPYLSINIFVAAMALRDVSQYLVLMRYGFASREYTYAYYYSDALLTVLMYLAIMYLAQQVFREMHIGRYVRWVTAGLLVGTALFAGAVIQRNAGHLASRFVVELSQDLYFVGMVLTYLLWVAVFKLRETRTRLVQLVLALGVYFSATAALWALRNMFDSTHAIAAFALTLLGVLLPAAWAYTFTMVPEEARLAPAGLAEEAAARR